VEQASRGVPGAVVAILIAAGITVAAMLRTLPEPSS